MSPEEARNNGYRCPSCKGELIEVRGEYACPSCTLKKSKILKG